MSYGILSWTFARGVVPAPSRKFLSYLCDSVFVDVFFTFVPERHHRIRSPCYWVLLGLFKTEQRTCLVYVGFSLAR